MSIFAFKEMSMLFEDTKFLDYKFPIPQYLGAKHIHRSWIAQFIPENTTTVLDAFSGSQSIAYMFKQLGKKVVTNDFLSFNNFIGKALIENANNKLETSDIDILFSPNSNPVEYSLIKDLFTNLFFL
ncbi:MAG: DNA adenine methylase, partial [Bacteroidales bacterium]|nr:DNA adenine methylase [Bacteroidales bacterium]